MYTKAQGTINIIMISYVNHNDKLCKSIMGTDNKG